MSRCEECGLDREAPHGFYGCLCMGFAGPHFNEEAFDAAKQEAKAWLARAADRTPE